MFAHIANHSVPSRVISDRGANLMSDEVKSFLESLGARKYETTPYKPSSNGSVERFHRFLSGTSIWTLYCSRTEYYRLMGWTFHRSRSSTGVVPTYLSTTFCFERITSQSTTCYFEKITPHLYKRLKNTWTCYTKLNSTCTKL